MKAKTFKELVRTLAEVETKANLYTIMAEIDRSFCSEKINWKDHEALYTIAEGLLSATVLPEE